LDNINIIVIIRIDCLFVVIDVMHNEEVGESSSQLNNERKQF